jgi:putative FmdB family regulatory protein
MPTYEYKCDACGYAFERFQPITSDPIKRCPECKKAKVRRLIGTGAGMIFKGSGFYITDYAKKDHVASAKADSAQGDKSESTEKKTDTAEKKSDAPAKTETATPAASASKEVRKETKSS